MNIYLIIKKEGGKDGNIEQNEKFFAATEQGFVERNLHISCCSILGTQKHILLLNYGILEVTGKACNEGELGVFSRQKIFLIHKNTFSCFLKIISQDPDKVPDGTDMCFIAKRLLDGCVQPLRRMMPVCFCLTFILLAMSKVKMASLEEMKGHVGNMTYFIRGGVQMNRKANSLMTPPTEEEAIENQKTIQLTFKTIGLIGRAMVPVVSRGFKDRPKGWTPFNKFMNLNYSVVTVTDLEMETVSVDFESICCAEGILVPPIVSVTQEEGSGALNFTVTAQKDEGVYCGAKDKVYAGILSAGKIYRSKLVELGTRGAGESVSVTLPDFFDGELHVYAFARAAKGKMASTSMYLPLE